MKTLRNIFLVAVGLLMFTGCASYFKKKECNKTNWYQHGFNIAMTGQRLDADDFVSQCKKVDADVDYAKLDVGFKAGMANYCTPETIYGIGRSGKIFTGEMCDSGKLSLLKREHLRGVVEYCRPDNAYKVGAKGETYGSICPKKLERKFLKEYSKGRKVYLRGQIEDKKVQIQQLRGDIVQYERDKSMLLVQLSSMPSSRIVTRNRTYNPNGSMSTSKDVSTDQRVEDNRHRVQNHISRKDREIKDAHDKITILRSEVRAHKREIRSLR